MRSLPLLLFVSLFTVPVDGLKDPSVPDIFFPFGTDEGDSVVPVGDDVSSPAVNIATGFPFLFGSYRTVFVRIKVSSTFTSLLSYVFAILYAINVQNYSLYTC